MLGRRRRFVLRWIALNTKIIFADGFRLSGSSLSFERHNVILLAQERGRELERYGFVSAASVGFECFLLPYARAADASYRRAVIAVIIAFENEAQSHGLCIGIEPKRICFVNGARCDGQKHDGSYLCGRDLRRLDGRFFSV